MSRILPVILLVMAAGCGTVNTVSTRSEPSSNSVSHVKQVNDAVDSLFLKATEVRLAPAKSGLLEAQVDIANDDFRTRRFMYRFQWLDARGGVIESALLSNWQQAQVDSGGSTTIFGIAPSRDAVDFRLQVRASDR